MTIINASKRTDIPHWHPDWFIQRVRAGLVQYANPMNTKQIVTVSLKPDDVTALVLWTKNIRPLLPHMDELEDHGLPYYTHFTLNAYGKDMEPHLPDLTRRIEAFHLLAQRGHPVVWRYDPILLSGDYTPGWHEFVFANLCQALKGATTDCRISFLDFYNVTQRNLTRLPGDQRPALPSHATMNALAESLRAIASQHGIAVSTCTESLVTACPKGACVDPVIIRAIRHEPDLKFSAGSQRAGCGCVQAKDIGAYDTCATGCLYCYANANPTVGTDFLATQADRTRISIKPIP